MNIIDTLKTRVAASILGGSANESQLNVLDQFLSLFVTQLANKDTNLTGAHSSGHDILDRVFPQHAQREQVIDKLADVHGVGRDDAKFLVESAAPVAYTELHTMAGGQPLPQFLQQHMPQVLNRLPGWASALLPAGLLASFGAAHSTAHTTETTYKVADHQQPVQTTTAPASRPTPVVTEVREERSGLPKWLLPLLALLILIPLLLWLMRSCSEKPAPVVQPQQNVQATPAPAAALVPAMLTLETDQQGNVTKCNGMVANESIKTSILNALKGKFGDTAACDVMVDAKYDTNMPIVEKLADAFALVKTTPNSRLDVNGNNITVSAPDQATADRLVGQLKTLLPAYMITGSALAPATAIVPTEQGAIAVPADQASVVWEDNKIKFYFATAKSEVAQGAVDKAQDVLTAAKAGKNIGITGYTDSTGDPAFNDKLAKERAKSVKQFLIDNGVPEAQIQLIKPADNTGAMGKNQEGRRVDVYVVE